MALEQEVREYSGHMKAVTEMGAYARSQGEGQSLPEATRYRKKQEGSSAGAHTGNEAAHALIYNLQSPGPGE